MIRLILIAIIAAAFIVDAADARRRVVYRIERKAKPPAEASNTVRIIPIVRWQIWCDRIGGLECPSAP